MMIGWMFKQRFGVELEKKKKKEKRKGYVGVMSRRDYVGQ